MKRRTDIKNDAKKLRVITLQAAIEKSPILLSYCGGSNNTFADCTFSENDISASKKQNIYGAAKLNMIFRLFSIAVYI